VKTGAAAIVALALVLGACATDTAREEQGNSVLLPVSSDPTISFSIWLKVGSQNDPRGKEGLAYLTAQMLAEASTENNRYEDILEQLFPIASGYQVRVDREMTTLTGRTHRDNTGVFLDLFTDAYLRPAFDPDDFQRVKNDAINYLENVLRYSSDEELGKAAVYSFIFQGTRYAHPPQGTVEGLRSITVDDVRGFYERHYTQSNATPGLAGGFDETLAAAFEVSLGDLTGGRAPSAPGIEPETPRDRQVLLVSKPRADASISFGFPIEVHRGERDFYALWVANSWLGEHRNQASHLFKVIRETRGLNYGDYSYIEAFPEGGRRNMPPANVARRHQIFEVWIRTLPNEHAHFALRAAVRELMQLVDDGLTEAEFELTRSFLRKYVLHFAETTSARLGYAVDDRFYGIDGEGHLERFRRMMDELTLADVNAAIQRHLQYENMKIAIVTGEAERLKEAIVADAPSPMEYGSPKPQAILDEDRAISEFPLNVAAEDVFVISVDDIFQRGSAP